MKTKYLLILIFLTTSCKSQDRSLFQFDPKSLTENNITLAEIADDIKYIPLDNSFPIGSIYANIQFINSSIYISNSDIGILTFFKDGNFRKRIGSKGRGPGEYLYNYLYTVDKNTGTVYINDSNIIKVFSKDGDFLRSISLKEYGGSIDKIEAYNSKIFVTYMMQFNDAKYDWLILDTLGKLIQKKDRSLPAFNSNWLEDGGSYIYDNKIFYWNQYGDTVFSVSPDLREKPSFIFSRGDYRLPRLNIADPNQLKQYLHVQQIFETSHFLAIYYFFEKSALVLIDKKNRNTYISSRGSDESGGIFNDFDGGTFFLPKSYMTENGREYMVGYISPYKLKALTASEKFINSTPKYIGRKQELLKLASSIKETDNPILMVVRLKI